MKIIIHMLNVKNVKLDVLIVNGYIITQLTIAWKLVKCNNIIIVNKYNNIIIVNKIII